MPHDFSIKYNGRAFSFQVVVNTDEDPHVIAERLRKAAAGPKLNATVVAVSAVTLPELLDVFRAASNIDKKTGRA